MEDDGAPGVELLPILPGFFLGVCWFWMCRLGTSQMMTLVDISILSHLSELPGFNHSFYYRSGCPENLQVDKCCCGCQQHMPFLKPFPIHINMKAVLTIFQSPRRFLDFYFLVYCTVWYLLVKTGIYLLWVISFLFQSLTNFWCISALDFHKLSTFLACNYRWRLRFTSFCAIILVFKFYLNALFICYFSCYTGFWWALWCTFPFSLLYTSHDPLLSKTNWKKTLKRSRRCTCHCYDRCTLLRHCHHIFSDCTTVYLLRAISTANLNFTGYNGDGSWHQSTNLCLGSAVQNLWLGAAAVSLLRQTDQHHIVNMKLSS